MQLDRPRFRQDLVAELVEDAGARFIDVMDPDSGNVFRFFEVEYSIACAMDGARDVPGLVQWAKDELGLAPRPAEVQTVIATLGQLGYLDPAAAGEAPAVSRAPTPQVKVPAARPAAPANDDLRPGVVVGQKRSPAPAPDLELGHAGSSSAPAPKPLPTSDIELAAGPVVVSRTKTPAHPPVEDIALGTPGRADVSTDLSEGVDIGVEDVKAAVRASQVMRAVDVPPELAAMLESKPAAAQPAAPPAPPPRRNTPPPMPAVKPPVETARAPLATPAPVPAAPAPAPVAAAEAKPKPATEAPAPQGSKTSRGLIAVLVVVVLAAVGYLAYPYVMKKLAPEAPPPKPVVTAPKPPAPPPPPPAESHKLATTPEQTTEVKPSAPATIDTLVADGPVAANAVIATYTGSKPLITEVAALSKDVETRLPAEIAQVQKDVDAAAAANNTSKLASARTHLTERQSSLADKQAKLAARQADLAKLELVAPVAGTVSIKSKLGAHVTPTDVVFTVTQPAVRTVTFAKADGATAGAHVLLATKDHATVACIVTASAPGAITIECPSSAVADGAEVTYGGVDTSGGSDAAGSASAGSASATGSAATAAPADTGSAAPASPPIEAPPAPKKVAPKQHAKAKPAAKPADAEGSSTDTAPEPAPAPAAPAAPAPADSTGSN